MAQAELEVEDNFSTTVDNVLLKLSKEHGFSIQKDDYVLTQLFLNKEILSDMISAEVQKLSIENEKTKNYFRDAMVQLTKAHNEKTKKYERIAKTSIALSIIAIASSVILFSL